MPPRRIKTTIGLALVCVVLANGCSSPFVKSMSGLNALYQQLTAKYHEAINVHLNDPGYLTITFINSKLNNEPPARRFERAQDVAVFVALNYQDIKSIQTVWVVFVASQTRFMFFHYTQAIDALAFDKNGKSLKENNLGDPADLRSPVATFDPTRNQTDVSITRIQLEGDMKHGIAMVPHFTLAGNATTGTTNTAPPRLVVLDFASYAPKPVFTGKVNLEIYCDGRLLMKSTITGPAAEPQRSETAAQFFSAGISFKNFQRMATARNVRIVLGPKRFELLPDDINALAGMNAYVTSTTGVNGR